MSQTRAKRLDDIAYDQAKWATMTLRKLLIIVHTASYLIWMISLYLIYALIFDQVTLTIDAKFMLLVIGAVVAESTRYIISLGTEVISPRAMQSTQFVIFAISMLVYFTALLRIDDAIASGPSTPFYMMVTLCATFTMINLLLLTIDVEYYYRAHLFYAQTTA